MVGYQNGGPGQASERPYVSLVSEQRVLPLNQVDLLQPYFAVGHITPQDALCLSPSEKEEAMKETAAVLVHWGEQSPAVICGLKDIAHRSAVPIIALCQSNEAEHVAALMVGANDALTGPVSPVSLQARLLAYRRLVNRASMGAGQSGDGTSDVPLLDANALIPEAHDVCTVGPLTLDRTGQQFFVRGDPVKLTPKEFDLMVFLMQRVGVCLLRDEILDQVWGIDYDAETNVLGTLVYTLRRKLAAYGLGDTIQTVRGVGYRLVTQPAVRVA